MARLLKSCINQGIGMFKILYQHLNPINPDINR